MKRISMCALSVVLVVSVSGCATTGGRNKFFGIQMSTERYADGLVITSTDKNDFTYKYNPSQMDPQIVAYGRITPGFLLADVNVSIYNKTKQPIMTNFYTDEFYVITDSDQRYNLTKFISDYEYKDYINPEEWAYYDLSAPDGLNSQLKKQGLSAVKYIVAIIGGGSGSRQKIVMVLIPKYDGESK